MEEKSVKLSDGVAIDAIESIARICHETNRVYCHNGVMIARWLGRRRRSGRRIAP